MNGEREAGEILARLTAVETKITDIATKQDQIMAALNMGRGAWYAVIQVGAALLVIAAIAAAVANWWPKN